MDTPRPTRRDAFRRVLLLAASGGAGMTSLAGGAQPVQGNATVLVAYLSRSGNTRVVAGQIARAQGADLFEILPAQPYPEDYPPMVDQAKRESDAGYEPPLKAVLPSIARYRTIFLGFPIWGMTAPPPIRSFLSRHDFTGKTLVPFVTHGGYGVGQSLSVLSRAAASARIAEAFVMQSDQERDTLQRVTHWLGQRPATR